jgi:SAM-dependent methyltransferase
VGEKLRSAIPLFVISRENALTEYSGIAPMPHATEFLERPLRREDWDMLFEATIDFYKRHAHTYADQWVNDVSIDEEKRMFLAALTPKSNVLDAGCGPGHHAKFFAEAGHYVTGVDFCEEFIDIAHEQHIGAAVFQVGDVRNLNVFKRNTFDGVWACAVCVHTPREFLDTQLNEFLAVLKPGGALGISFRIGDPAGQQDDGRFFEFYEEDGVLGTIQRVGFRIAKTRNVTSSKRTLEGKHKLKHWLFVLAIAINPKESILLQEGQ